MAGTESPSGLKTFDDLGAALSEAGGEGARKCDRCRQAVGTVNAALSVRTPPRREGAARGR